MSDMSYQRSDGSRSSQPVSKEFPLPVGPGSDIPLGFVQLAALSSVTPLSSIPAGATRALLQAESQNVRWRDDGTDPTAAVGIAIYVGQLVEYVGNLSAIKFIEVAGGAKLNISYYR